jgi:hypothetical protein
VLDIQTTASVSVMSCGVAKGAHTGSESDTDRAREGRGVLEHEVRQGLYTVGEGKPGLRDDNWYCSLSQRYGEDGAEETNQG